MASEVEEKYTLENNIPQTEFSYRVLAKVYEFHKTHGQYPAQVILNPKHQHIGSTSFVLFKTTLAPAIKPLEDRDVKGREVQGYYVAIEYNKGIDENALICRGFAETP